VTGEHAAAIRWAGTTWGRGVREVRPLSGGWTSTILGLVADDGDRAVLRLMTKEPWRSHAPAMLQREAGVQHQLARGPVPAPVSVGVDPAGSEAGAPAHLMTWLPGALELGRCDDDVLGRLARLLGDVHRHDPGGAQPREYQSWAHPAKRVVPPWAGRPELWEHAFAELHTDPPPYDGVFLHRDFHLGNVLWAGGAVTGLVDWVETSWGPAALDVAHAATYLAMLHGLDAADRFTVLAGDRSAEERRYWELMDVVGYLPDPVKVVATWRERGIAVSDDLARGRLEDRLAAVLG